MGLARQFSIEVGPVDLATQSVCIAIYPPREYWRWSGDPRAEQPYNPADLVLEATAKRYARGKYPVKWPSMMSREMEQFAERILDDLLTRRKIFLLPPFDKLPANNYHDWEAKEIEVDFYDDTEGPTTSFPQSHGDRNPAVSTVTYDRSSEAWVKTTH